MKWFKHHTDAHDNNKLTKVRMKYGAEGYAIYWYCLELIAGDLGESLDINFELKHDSEVIGFNLKIDSRKVEEIMRFMVDLGLFEDIEGQITCIKLAKYIEKRNTRNLTIHKIVDAAVGVADCRRQTATNGTLSPTVAVCRVMPTLDTDTDTDTDTDIKDIMSGKPDAVRFEQETKIPNCPTKQIIDLYHKKLPELPRCRTLRSGMEQHISVRWKENKAHQTLEFWEAFFDNVRTNDWWMGRSQSATGGTFLIPGLFWLVKPINFDKVINWRAKK